MDTKLKLMAKELFKSYGLSLSDGINFLLKQATDKKNLILSNDLDIEVVSVDDSDYDLMKELKKEKSHPLDKVIQEFG